MKVPHEIKGFSQTKDEPDYWQTAVSDFWEETGLSTDEFDLRVIVDWFDKRRENE